MPANTMADMIILVSETNITEEDLMVVVSLYASVVTELKANGTSVLYTGGIYYKKSAQKHASA